MSSPYGLNFTDTTFFAAVTAELSRARARYPTNLDTLPALVEEVGELTQALLKKKHQPEEGFTSGDIWSEAVQVATMAMRVATEGDANFPGYNPMKGIRMGMLSNKRGKK